LELPKRLAGISQEVSAEEEASTPMEHPLS
jgi:hypothetical protein